MKLYTIYYGLYILFIVLTLSLYTNFILNKYINCCDREFITMINDFTRPALSSVCHVSDG